MSLATEADIRAAFKKFDVDGNGFLSLDELKALLQRSGGGKALTDSEVSEFMYRFDAYENDGNNDGKLSIEELVNGLLASQLYTACLPKNLNPEEFEEMLKQASWKQLSWIGGPKQGPCKDVFRLLIEQKSAGISLLKTALNVAMNMVGVGKGPLGFQLNKVMTLPAFPAMPALKLTENAELFGLPVKALYLKEETALTLAARMNDSEAVKLLLKSGADKTKSVKYYMDYYNEKGKERDKTGEMTALDIAEAYGYSLF